MGIASAYSDYIAIAFNGGNANEARSDEAFTVSGTISNGSDSDGSYLESTGSPNYLSLPSPRLDYLQKSAGAVWAGSIKTTHSGSYVALYGCIDGATATYTQHESVGINLQDFTGAVLNGSLFLLLRGGGTSHKLIVRTGNIVINDGNKHKFAIKWIKETDTFEIWVDGVQRAATVVWSSGSTTLTTKVATYTYAHTLFSRNELGTISKHFPGKIYNFARISSSDFDAEALSNDPTIVFSADADTTAPSLTSATASATGATTASGSVTTNEATGTLYSVATTSATAPTKAQVKAGQDHAGSAAPWADNQAISSTGAKSVSVTGLTESTTYYLHHMHEDAATNQSDVVSSASFTTTGAFASTVSVADPLKNNTGTLLASQSGVKVAVLKAADLESVYEGTATTNGSGILSDITDAAIVAGSYHVAIKLTDGSVGITGAIEAV